MWRILGLACTVVCFRSSRDQLLVASAAKTYSKFVPTPGTLYVSPNGNDSNVGNHEEAPLRTLQGCVDKAKAANIQDGSCVMMTGRYTDPVNLERLGKITIKAAPGASPVIDGSEELDLSWNADASDSCVWRASMPVGHTVPWFLWAENNGELKPLTPARWPNAKLSDFSVFENPHATNGGPLSYSSASFTPSGPGGQSAAFSERAPNSVHAPKFDIDLELTDDPNLGPSLKDAGLDFTDTYVVQSLGALAQYTMAGKVSSFNKDTGSLTYQLPQSWKNIVTENKLAAGHSFLPYFFEGHPKLLDAEEEWSYNTSTKELLVYDCNTNPNNYKIRGRVRDISLTITKMTQVTLDGIELFGTTFKHSQGGSLTFQNVNFSYPTFNKRTIADVSDVVLTELGFTATSRLNMLGCRVLYADGAHFLAKFRSGAVFSNNLFIGSGYATSSSATISHVNNPADLKFDHNTVTYFNSMNAIAPGAKGSTISNNYFAYQGAMMDGAVIHMQAPYQSGTVVTGNWIHDSMVKAVRCDRINTVAAAWGENATITDNVVWRAGEIFVKGDHHKVSNNVVADCSGSMGAEVRGALGVVTHEYGGWSKPGENSNTKVENNAVDSILRNKLQNMPPLANNNLEGKLEVGGEWWKTMFVDYDNLDFRPKDGSVLLKDAANYIGAYPKDLSQADYAKAIPGSTLLSPLDHHVVPPSTTTTTATTTTPMAEDPACGHGVPTKCYHTVPTIQAKRCGWGKCQTCSFCRS